jgi:hypothetical protein
VKGARLLKQRFGVHMSSVSVRPRLAWYWRASRFLALSVLLCALGWWLFQQGWSRAEAQFMNAQDAFHRSSGDKTALATLVQQLRKENERLDNELALLANQAKVDAAAQANFTRSVADLHDENARLKEELAFFQKIMGGGTGQARVDVYDFQLRRLTTPNEFSFAALFFQQGPRDKVYHAKADLVIVLEDHGKEVTETYPRPASGKAAPLELDFKHYQRLEGTFKVPSEMTLKHVQLRLYESGSPPKVIRTANLS